MKKKLSLLFCFIFCFSIFAEPVKTQIPFFLDNWIFPQDYDFSKIERFPDSPVSPCSQTFDTSEKQSWFTITDNEDDRGVIPPYFAETYDISWGTDYQTIYDLLKIDSTFYIYVDYASEIITDDDAFKTLNFMKRIVLQNSENHKFYVSFLFPQSRDYKLTRITIQYKDKKTTLGLSPADYFQRYRASNWNRMSNLEQKALAFSAECAILNKLKNTDFEFSSQKNYMPYDAKKYLKESWDIESAQDLVNVLEEVDCYFGPEYNKKLATLNQYKDLDDLIKSNNYSAQNICKFVFIDQMKDKLGKYGIDAYDIALKLFHIRLSVFAGYISKADALKLAEPYIYETSKNYVNYEDFMCHVYAGRAFSGIKNNAYLTRVKNSFGNMHELNQYVRTVHFDASNADRDHIMSYPNCWFEPSKEYRIYFSDGNITSAAVSASSPIAYNSSVHGNEKTFFEKYYRKTWDSIPETERLANLFSSNLFLLNNCYPMSFDCSENFPGQKFNGAKILKDSWGINNYDELIENFNILQNHGHHGAYNDLAKLLEKHPDKTVLEISTLEGLTVLEVARLYFVRDMAPKLGPHGIEAWDEGRSIATLKWGIDAGYISKDEALELIEPITQKILNDYFAYADYINHYLAGRAFFGLSSQTSVDLFKKGLAANVNVECYFPTSEVLFTPEDPIVDYFFVPAKYEPSSEALQWEKVLSVTSRAFKPEELYALEDEFPYQPCLIYNHLSLLTSINNNEEALEYIEKNLELINALPENNEIYMNFNYIYLRVLNNLYRPMDCLAHFETLPVDLQENLYVFYQRAYAHFLIANISDDFETRITYQSRAISDFKLLQSHGMNLGSFLENWMKSVQ